ncbi:hypothetical protein K491DRAFT_711337 [Lophiostoma macrostomum CBS 122681]|uniref:Uncharacterized protein n=1 Tax=Lophiostoma macrostomum CBS 122681 TaxID=1314788 RepID=A0A6A6TQ65_9PLEO|nr:hypothetical protein K491DRAFT_711337 [Lophiostoma macrostomum CBS 122681]
MASIVGVNDWTFSRTQDTSNTSSSESKDGSKDPEEVAKNEEVTLNTLEGEARDVYIRKMVIRSSKDHSIPVPQDVEKAIINELCWLRDGIQSEFMVLDWSEEQQQKLQRRGEEVLRYTKTMIALAEKYGLDNHMPSKTIAAVYMACETFSVAMMAEYTAVFLSVKPSPDGERSKGEEKYEEQMEKAAAVMKMLERYKDES